MSIALCVASGPGVEGRLRSTGSGQFREVVRVPRLDDTLHSVSDRPRPQSKIPAACAAGVRARCPHRRIWVRVLSWSAGSPARLRCRRC